MDHPAQYRLVYHAGTRQFFIAYDFGLTKDTARFPSSADFRFVLYRFNPRWGFRAALQKYYDLFPQQFARRVTREGVWMPFTDIAKVPGFEDFGFGFQEGASNVPFDDQHGIASFIYVEPMSHWLAMPRDVPRTYDDALSVLNKDLSGARGKQAAEMAAATLTSGIENAEGRLFLHLEKAPWCDGGVFSLVPIRTFPLPPNTLSTKRWSCSKPSPLPSSGTNPSKSCRSLSLLLKLVRTRSTASLLSRKKWDAVERVLTRLPAPAWTACISTPSKWQPAR
jgi:hypothetical protein